MRVYNATMRINRLELLKSQIGVNLTEATGQIDNKLTNRLNDDYVNELHRMAGIMGDSAVSKLWSSTKVAKVIMSQTNSATFSGHLWANQDKLDQGISKMIVLSTTWVVASSAAIRMTMKLV